ncbi:MAG: transketolase C-terminal domain-containing protein [Chloroflexota bacterium]
MNLGKPNLDVFAQTLLELAQKDPAIMVVTGDSRGSARLGNFCSNLPEQVVEVGIAEQNLVGISAGLAMYGKKVFAVSPACFLTARSLEQIKNDVAYSDHPVKLIGISAGVSYGALGSTHHSVHDLAVLQAIPNIDIVVPADNFETRQAILASVNHDRPIYIRFGKRPVPDLYGPEAVFEIGVANHLQAGTDVTFISTGETVARAVVACDLLREDGISAGVISVHTIRPFDLQALLQAAQSSLAIITVEEHSTHGGLGSLCAASLLEAGCRIHFRRVGIPDENTVTGSQEDIYKHYGITAEGLSKTARELLQKPGTSNLTGVRRQTQAASQGIGL